MIAPDIREPGGLAGAPPRDAFDRRSLAAASPRFVHRAEVRFQDVDAGGLLFFARTFDYFHDAYFAFMAHAGLPGPAVLDRPWAAPLRHAEADFLGPLSFGDRLEIGLVCARWRGSLLKLGYRIAREGGDVAATGVTEHVIIDRGTASRVEPPVEFRNLFRALEDGSSAG